MKEDTFAIKGSLEDAKIAYRNGKYEEASLLFQKYASKNNAEALFFLGNMSADGLGFPLNVESAKTLLKKSSELGYLPAAYKLRQLENKNIHFYWNSNYVDSELQQNMQQHSSDLPQQDNDKKNNSEQSILDEIENLPDNDKLKICQKLALQGELESMYEYGHYLVNCNYHDYTNGAFWLGRAAQRGHAVAQYELGCLYLKGLGVNQDVLQAVLWLKRSSELGVVDAINDIAMIYCNKDMDYFNPKQGIVLLENIKEQKADVLVQLAKFLLDGIFVDKDLEKAKKYLQQAKDKGVVEASYVLGNLYIAEKNYTEGVPLLKDAAEHNNIDAIFSLGRLYEQGLGVAKLDDKAAFLYDKAAEMGNCDAQYYFACMCRKQNTVEGNKLARQWFEKSALQGNAQAMFEYGLILKNEADSLVKNDIEKENVSDYEKEHKVVWFVSNQIKPYFSQYKDSFNYLLQAAKANIVEAEYIVSQMYKNGIGINADESLALKWCKQAAEHGNFDAQLRMAEMYDQGEIFEPNLEQAVEWYSSASENGSEQATYCLAMMYCDGRGVEKNDTKAFELFKKASDLGFIPATYQVGIHYLRGIGCEYDLRSAEYFLCIAADAGYEDAVLELTKHYINNSEHNSNNAKLAVDLLNKEVKLGHSGGMYLLACMCLSGTGIPKNEAKALELLEKSADLGSRQAQYDLGMIYYDGVIVPRNYQKAVYFFKNSANLKLDCGQYMMGVCCRDGLGTLINYQQAYDYFLNAAELGYTQAYLALGKMYEKGNGVICNHQQAIHYYRLLANCGYEDAFLLIAKIYLSGNSNIHVDYEQAAFWLQRGALKHQAECCYELAKLHLGNKIDAANVDIGMELLRESANANYSEALYHLANMSMEGRYLQQSYSKAVSYLQKAVSLNHVKAATKLGQMYIKGSGCEYNPVAAADLFTTAANHGDTEAQFELAKLFKQGIGVPCSCFDAYIWSVLAVSCSDNYVEAKSLRNELVLSLTVAQITKAQYIATDYFNNFMENEFQ